jgi:signal transduction histidine kinase
MDATPHADRKQMDHAANPATIAPVRLLVVDDSDGIRDVLAIRLEREGYAVALARDANEAIEQIGANRFDLILLDMKLPGIGGLALLERLRARHSLLDVPIIMISGHGASENIVSALEKGANDYITKPFDMAVVMARVKTQLSLKQLKELYDRFLRTASHDLKKPVLLMLDVARQLRDTSATRGTMDEEGRSALNFLIDSGEFMQQIIEDLLEQHAIKGGRLRLTKLPTDIGALANQAIARNTAYAAGKGIALNAQFAPDLPTIMADDVRITQVLENLIGNAIKFSPADKPITVRARAEPACVVCEVSDAGPGITEADMKKLFIEYAKLHNVPTGKENSTGLGLIISKELIALHGGEIGARNNPGGGATFWFSLPIS